ncbi:unnamed protein product [Amoebophrya sp. A120]|nr:unnamed protein product [Amoebophrya sp. A120]|eukprot:GSA120T00004234001.1
MLSDIPGSPPAWWGALENIPPSTSSSSCMGFQAQSHHAVKDSGASNRDHSSARTCSSPRSTTNTKGPTPPHDHASSRNLIPATLTRSDTTDGKLEPGPARSASAALRIAGRDGRDTTKTECTHKMRFSTSGPAGPAPLAGTSPSSSSSSSRRRMRCRTRAPLPAMRTDRRENLNLVLSTCPNSYVLCNDVPKESGNIERNTAKRPATCASYAASIKLLAKLIFARHVCALDLRPQASDFDPFPVPIYPDYTRAARVEASSGFSSSSGPEVEQTSPSNANYGLELLQQGSRAGSAAELGSTATSAAAQRAARQSRSSSAMTRMTTSNQIAAAARNKAVIRRRTNDRLPPYSYKDIPKKPDVALPALSAADPMEVAFNVTRNDLPLDGAVRKVNEPYLVEHNLTTRVVQLDGSNTTYKTVTNTHRLNQSLYWYHTEEEDESSKEEKSTTPPDSSAIEDEGEEKKSDTAEGTRPSSGPGVLAESGGRIPTDVVQTEPKDFPEGSQIGNLRFSADVGMYKTTVRGDTEGRGILTISSSRLGGILINRGPRTSIEADSIVHGGVTTSGELHCSYSELRSGLNAAAYVYLDHCTISGLLYCDSANTVIVTSGSGNVFNAHKNCKIQTSEEVKAGTFGMYPMWMFTVGSVVLFVVLFGLASQAVDEAHKEREQLMRAAAGIEKEENK